MNTTIYICAAAYLLGSIPFGLLLTRLAGLGDIRAIGSGSIGATNVLRTGRRALAAATVLLDALKGTVAVLLAAYAMPGRPDVIAVAGLLALLGHCFPVWLKFRGGKGIATLFGVWLGLSPVVFLGMALAWLAGAFATRVSSCGAIALCIALPVLVYILVPVYFAASLVMVAVAMLKHRSNIARIVTGTEPKIGKTT